MRLFWVSARDLPTLTNILNFFNIEQDERSVSRFDAADDVDPTVTHIGFVFALDPDFHSDDVAEKEEWLLETIGDLLFVQEENYTAPDDDEEKK